MSASSLQKRSESLCYGGKLRRLRACLARDRHGDGVFRVPAPGRRTRFLPRVVLPGWPHMHAGHFRAKGRRATPGGRTRPDTRGTRHQPARRRYPRRGYGLGFRHWRRLLPRRHPGTLVEKLPHGQLRKRRAAGVGGRQLSCPARCTGDHGPFDGRPRRASLGAAPPGQDGVQCPRSRRSVTRCRFPGDTRRSAITWGQTRRRGRNTTPAC